MQTSRKLKCFKDNDATKVCMVSTCTVPALTCNKQECECKVKHKDCHFSVQTNMLFEKLRYEGEKYLPILNTIKEWYEAQIKLFKIQLEELTVIINEASLSLNGKESELSELMYEGKGEQILPKLVYDCVMSLGDLRETDYEMKKVKVDEKLKDASDKIDKELLIIRNSWKNAEFLDNLSFSQSLKHSTISVRQEGRVLAFTSGFGSQLFNSGNQGAFALLEPALSQKGIKRFRFKIRSDSGSGILGFGICHDDYLNNTQFKNESLSSGQGFYLFYSSGYMTSHKDQNECKQGNFTIQTSDIIEIVCDFVKNELSCMNITKNTKSSTLIFQKQNNKKLYLCARVYYATDSIQYIGCNK